MFDLPDISTLRQCSVLASTAYAAVFMVMARGRRDPWLVWWAVASATYSVVLVAFELAGDPMPPLLGPPIIALLALSSAMVLAGVRSFDGQRPIARWMWAVVAGVALVPGATLFFPGETAAMAGRILLSAGLALCMVAFGWPLVSSSASDGTRTARRIAGAALIAYVPSYGLAVVGEFLTARAVHYLALIPMLADQLLLGVANLSLLAIPGTRSQYLLREAALRDPLTGVWNRGALAASEGVLLVPGRVVLLVDVDHFKHVNDRHGHATGDRVLVAIAAALQRGVAGDFVCRMGGDEFLVVTSADDATAVADHIRACAGAGAPDLPPWSVSVGVARIEPGDSALADAMQRADGAMYRAKAAGRGRIAA